MLPLDELVQIRAKLWVNCFTDSYDVTGEIDKAGELADKFVAEFNKRFPCHAAN